MASERCPRKRRLSLAPPGIMLVEVKEARRGESKLLKPHVQKDITKVLVLRHIQVLSTERPWRPRGSHKG